MDRPAVTFRDAIPLYEERVVFARYLDSLSIPVCMFHAMRGFLRKRAAWEDLPYTRLWRYEESARG